MQLGWDSVKLFTGVAPAHNLGVVGVMDDGLYKNHSMTTVNDDLRNENDV